MRIFPPIQKLRWAHLLTFGLLLVLAVGVPIGAQTNSAWIAGDGNWSNAANWSNGVPNGNYNATIASVSGFSTINLDIKATVNTLNLQCCDTLNITSSGILTIQAGGAFNAESKIELSGGAIVQASPNDTLNLNQEARITGTGTIQASEVNLLQGRLDLQPGDSLSITGNVLADSSGNSISTGASLRVGGSYNNDGDTQINTGMMTVHGNLINTRDEGAFFNVSDGGMVSVGGTFNNVTNGASGIVNISGGSVVNIAQDLNNHDDGYFSSAAGTLISGGSSLNVKGNLNNGTATLSNEYFVLGTGSTFTVQKDLNNFGALTLATGSAGTVNGNVNNAGSVQIDSTSVLTAKSGFNQTAGATQVDGILSAHGTGVNIAGGTLSGAGMINGSVTNAGTLSPGDAPGTLTINGNYTQTSSGSLIESVGWINGLNASLLRVNGTANLDGTLALSLLAGFTPIVGDSFILMTFLRDYGVFNTITGLNLGNGEYLEVFYDPHDVRVEVAQTPEPSSMLLLLIGVVSLLIALHTARTVL